MFATLSTIEFDPDGHVILPAAGLGLLGGESRRRVSRITTLDGGVAINDFGYTAADETIELSWLPESRALDDNVQRLLETYPRLHVAILTGFYLVAPESFARGSEESVLRLLVIAKLSA